MRPFVESESAVLVFASAPIELSAPSTAAPMPWAKYYSVCAQPGFRVRGVKFQSAVDFKPHEKYKHLRSWKFKQSRRRYSGTLWWLQSGLKMAEKAQILNLTATWILFCLVSCVCDSLIGIISRWLFLNFLFVHENSEVFISRATWAKNINWNYTLFIWADFHVEIYAERIFDPMEILRNSNFPNWKTPCG